MSSKLPENLSNHHLRTLDELFAHPVGRNIEWPKVLALLTALGDVDERHDGKFAVTIGGTTEIFERPPTKDLEVQQVVDIRRLLLNAGLGPIDRA